MLPMNGHHEQLPFLTVQETPNSEANNVSNFPSSPFPLQSRMQPELNYPPLTSTSAEPQAVATQTYRQVNHRFMNLPEDTRHLPGESIHDSSYDRQSGPLGIPSIQGVMPPVPSAHHAEQSSANQSNSSTGSKPRKEISNVVIACNQWCVRILSFFWTEMAPTDWAFLDWNPHFTVAAGRFAATLKGPLVTIAPGDRMFAYMMPLRREEAQISTQVLDREGPKSGRLTIQTHQPLNAGKRPPTTKQNFERRWR
jgi:hypothetical protein